MCRSKSEGGRRCPRSTSSPTRHTPTAASAATTAGGDSGSGSAPAPQEPYAAAVRRLDAACAAVGDRPGYSVRSTLLLGSISRQDAAGEVKQRRAMLATLLEEDGVPPAEAQRRITEVEQAHQHWKATPEPKSARGRRAHPGRDVVAS